MRTYKDIYYANTTHERQTLDMYLPDGDNFDVFVYIHGGGLNTGSKNGCAFRDELISAGIGVILINYRLLPHFKYPAYIEDCASAVAWTFKNIGEYGGNGNVSVGGSSAGGYLSMMLCFDKKYLAIHDINSDKVKSYVFDAGQPTTHFSVLKERGEDPRKVIIDEAAPLYYVKHNPNYPPMKIIVTDDDMPNRYEQTQLLISTLKHFGNDVSKVDFEIIKNYKHSQYVGKILPDGKSLFAKVLLDFFGKI